MGDLDKSCRFEVDATVGVVGDVNNVGALGGEGVVEL